VAREALKVLSDAMKVEMEGLREQEKVLGYMISDHMKVGDQKKVKLKKIREICDE
jgi:hypothetical protein